MTADHLRPLLESERDSEVLSELVASLAEERVQRLFGRQSELDA